LVLFWGVGASDAVLAQDAQGPDTTTGALAQRTDAGSLDYQPADENLLTFADQDVVEAISVESGPVQVLGVGDLVRMLLVLAGVLASIYGLFWFIKKTRKLGTSDDESILKIRDQIGLGGTRSLYLIQVGERVFMIGGTDSSVNLLSEIDDTETLQAIQVALGAKGERPAKTFSSLLHDLVGRQATGPDARSAETSTTNQGFDFLHNQRERLRKW